MDKQKEENGGVTLSVEVASATIANSVNKMESFAKMVEKLSEEDVCRGMVELAISAKIVDYRH